MNEAVYFDVHFKINQGKLETFKEIAEAMIAATRQETGARGYEWHISDDGTECRLLETYANEAAVTAHISGKAVQEFLPKLLQVSSISGFEVYGYPGSPAAQILSARGARIFRRWNGIAS